MKKLTRDQMKRVKGGDGSFICSANCPPGQIATCSSDVDSCSYVPGEGSEYDYGVTCTNGSRTIKVACFGIAP